LGIEQEMGRERRIKWGQRLIDIDLLFYGRIRIHTDRLKLPHPYLHQRNFVLQPMLEIAPDLIHPAFDLSIRQLAERTTDKRPAWVYEP
ncbi:MAG TPA: 2-amino-4-hydroxy-6-hydroxymethyldihydropteridine diphosphokinase, partial [Phaeodactylibacter sp.]|nr:2-amino-4-hydroxy-6-hydroxymethyldihydropteridine diphosphokinase [Phaeodactylibacter sp.]